MSVPFQQREERTHPRSARAGVAWLLILFAGLGATLLLLSSAGTTARPLPTSSPFTKIQRAFFNSTPTLTYDHPTQTTQVGDTITGRLTAGDADGDVLTLTAGTPVNGGAVVVNQDGSFTYTVPTSMYETGGTDTFTVTASDAGASWHIHGLSGFRNSSPGLPGGDGHEATATVVLTIAPVNAAPVVGSPAYTVGAPDPASGAVQGQVHVTDPDFDVLSYSVTSDPTKGAVSLNSADGTFTYTPTPAARHGAAYENAGPDQLADSFTVNVDDGHGHAVTVPVTCAIDPLNTPPTMTVVVDDPNAATGQVTVWITVTDPDLDPLVYIVTQDPAFGTVAPTPGGYTYTPTPEAREAAAQTPGVDTDSFEVRASDLHGGIDTETVTVTISPNNAPVATDDTYTTDEDTPLTVPAPGVLTNDTDIDNDTLTVTDYTQPAHGTVTVNTDGSFTYTPATNYNGPDGFTYTASDPSGASDTANVALTVTPVNDPPALGDPAYTLTAPDPVDGSLDGHLYLADPDGDPIFIVEIIQGIRNGTLNGDPVGTGDFSYTPELAARIRAGTGGENAEHLEFKVSDGVNPPVTVTIDIPISPADMTVTDTIASGPTNAIVFSPDGTAYRANDDGTVFVVDPSGAIVDTIAVGANPSALALSGDRLYVANSGSDNVSVIDTTNNSVIQTIAVGDDPRGVAISESAGFVYVSNYGSNTVTVINTTTYIVLGTIGVGSNPWAVAASADGGHYVYVANTGSPGGDSVSVIDTTSNTVITTFTGVDAPIGLATGYHDGRNWLYVTNSDNGTVTVFDTDTNSYVNTVNVGPRPYNVVLSADGSIAYVSLSGEAGNLDNRVVPVDTRYHNVLDTNFDLPGVQPLTVGTAPQGMAFNPVTNQLYVINEAAGTISVVEMSAGTP